MKYTSWKPRDIEWVSQIKKVFYYRIKEESSSGLAWAITGSSSRTGIANIRKEPSTKLEQIDILRGMWTTSPLLNNFTGLQFLHRTARHMN